MQLIKLSQVPKQSRVSSFFTGEPITAQPIATEQMGKTLDMALVNFGKGVRTKLHTHPTSDQVLIATAGKGRVATEQKELVVEPGDIVFIPAGEKHYHGATEDSEFSHIYILAGGSADVQVEE